MADSRKNIMEKITAYIRSSKCEPRDRVFFPLLFGIFDALVKQNEFYDKVWGDFNKIVEELIKQFAFGGRE